MNSLLIVNAHIVNEGSIFQGDVLIVGGRIESIGRDLSGCKAMQVLDAQGRYLLPGLIDDQVHFREPGMLHKGNFELDSRAAIAGGITSFMDMPNTLPPTLTLAQLQEKKRLAAGRAAANYGFYLGASTDNLETIKALDPAAACGINVFIGSSCAQKLVDDPEILEDIFHHAPVLVTAHCEDTPTIIENEESYRSIYGDNIPIEYHPVIRSEEACFLASSQALELAAASEVRLHILHVSTAQEVELFQNIDLAEKRITAEVSTPYLHFSDEDYASRGALIKVNPAIKTAEDRAGLIQGLLDGRLDVIGSGHAPHLLADKQGRNYFSIPSGMPMVQDSLLALLEHYHDGIFSLEFLAEKTSHAMADLFEVKERGYIREGYWADLVLVDLERPHQALHANSLAKCAWTPFDGFEFRSSIVATIVNGQLAWHEGHWLNFQPMGQALEFDR